MSPFSFSSLRGEYRGPQGRGEGGACPRELVSGWKTHPFRHRPAAGATFPWRGRNVNRQRPMRPASPGVLLAKHIIPGGLAPPWGVLPGE
jgi:hypothetical protein